MKLFSKTISPNGRIRIYFLKYKIFSFRSTFNYFYMWLLSYKALLKYQTFISDFIKNKYFYENFDKQNLLKNLDPDSLKAITPVLAKYEYLASGGTCYEFLCDPEITAYNNTVAATFYHSIKTESMGEETVYRYKDYILPINLFETSVFIDEHGLKKVNTSRVHTDDTIIDAGCFIADSALIFRKYFPHNPIVSFEATNENYQLAQKTVTFNALQNITIENIALGDKEGEIYINTYSGGATKTSEQKNSDSAQKCPLTTLDTYVKKHNIKKVGLIKVDIEGAEQAFLRGALETIKRDRPVMLLSIYHNYSDLLHIKPYIESLDLKYTLSIHKPADTLFTEILLICEPNE